MQQLGEIPLGTEVVETDRTITLFFRQLWAQLITMVAKLPTVANLEKTGQTAAIATATAYTVQSAGVYRIAVSLQKTIADGISSSLTVTVGWTSRGIAMTHAFAALTTDAAGANDTDLWQFSADANSDITYAIAYASNTPAKMTYNANVVVEQLAS